MSQSDNTPTNPDPSNQEAPTSSDRPSLVESPVVIQRSADTDRVRVTERSDVQYFSLNSGKASGKNK